jgi:3-hydroxyisobutyrate dehydrogenase-like beta-hydroxyacid dehydrogenase
VGVIGLGAMGGPIVRHLLAAGREVHVLDPDADAVRRCTDEGAVEAPDGAALAAATDVVLVVVSGDDDVLAVCCGPSGVLAGARPGSAVLLCSSIRPDTCRQVAAAAPPGVRVLDAGMTGGVRGVEAGRVNLLVGGAATDLEAVRPALSPWCSSVHHLGPLGAGQVAKTANNLIHWAQITAIVEALSLTEAYGLSAPAVRAALQDGPTDSRTLRELEQMRLTWHAKDLANAHAMADAVGASLPLAGTVQARMREITVEDVARLLGPREVDDQNAGQNG